MPTDVNEKAAAPMSADEEERILSMRIGGTTVGEALDAAIASGHVLRDADGQLRLAGGVTTSPFFQKNTAAVGCKFLMRFMYNHVYQKQTVPIGCSRCYKVKVISSTLRQLMAVKAIAEELPYPTKSGPEVENRQTQALYGTYFYFSGLDPARKGYRQIRPKVDADPELGPKVKMIIKRGCTEYERAHGPLDYHKFDPRQKEIETYLLRRFDPRPTTETPSKEVTEGMKLLNMVQTAYQIGDDTYKDFTGGKDLYPPIVTYDPEEPGELSIPEV